jgi:hypothetical protein
MAETTRRLLYILIGYTLITVIFIVSVLAYFNMNGSASENNMFEGTYHRLFGETPISGGNYSFSPPVPMYRAVVIGLENGGWDASSLRNMTVHVSLDYYIFYTNFTELYQLASKDNITLAGRPNPNLNSTGTGFEFISEVTAPVESYQPQIIPGASCRYVWAIAVEENSGLCIPPPGFYIVDAATAQMVPTGPLI